jgi:hypothetical protein
MAVEQPIGNCLLLLLVVISRIHLLLVCVCDFMSLAEFSGGRAATENPIYGSRRCRFSS